MNGYGKSVLGRLLEDLKDRKLDNPYLDRVQSRVELAQERSTVEREIIQEIAQALGRAEDKVNIALAHLHSLDQRIAQQSEPPRIRPLVEEFNRRRHDAQRALLDLVIHREALGMYHNEILDTLYPIPPRKK